MGCCSSASEQVPLSLQTPQIIKPILRSVRKRTFLASKLVSITDRYEILRTLGSGTIGTLFLALEIESGKLRTIREVSKSAHISENEIFHEYNILTELDHPNILKVFEAFETPRNYYIVLENISGGALNRKFKKIGIEGVLSKYVHEMFAGISYLHEMRIVHCNLASEYVVFNNSDEDATIKLIGFGSARKLSVDKEPELKNLKFSFASPEIFRGEYSEKSDI